MKYIISIILLILISFVSILITMSLINRKNKFKTNLKSTSLFIIVTLPIISLVGSILFLIFKLIAIIIKVQADTFEIFIIAIAGSVSIFICDFITKKIMLGLSTKYFASKYKNTKLTEKEMMNILESKQKAFNVYSLIIMFLANTVIYFVIMSAMSIEYSIMFLIIISIISLISYKILFKGKAATGN